MSAEKQQSFRVSPEVKIAFGAYAGAIGMNDSELARVLIARERRHHQLAKLVSTGARIISGNSGDTKITAHFLTVADRLQFNEYAKTCGVAPGRAGAWIIERELTERWLDRAISTPPDK